MSPDEQLPPEIGEFLDPYHPRASLHGDDRIIIGTGKVLDNIASTMERCSALGIA